MALTCDFCDTIRERAQREPAFSQSLLREGLQLINSGDSATGRAVLRNYISATIGFVELARENKDPLAQPATHVRPERESECSKSLWRHCRASKNEGVSKGGPSGAHSKW
jgi:hypothetical protein